MGVNTHACCPIFNNVAKEVKLCIIGTSNRVGDTYGTKMGTGNRFLWGYSHNLRLFRLTIEGTKETDCTLVYCRIVTRMAGNYLADDTGMNI